MFPVPAKAFIVTSKVTKILIVNKVTFHFSDFREFPVRVFKYTKNCNDVKFFQRNIWKEISILYSLSQSTYSLLKMYENN